MDNHFSKQRKIRQGPLLSDIIQTKSYCDSEAFHQNFLAHYIMNQKFLTRRKKKTIQRPLSLTLIVNMFSVIQYLILILILTCHILSSIICVKETCGQKVSNMLYFLNCIQFQNSIAILDFNRNCSGLSSRARNFSSNELTSPEARMLY